MKCQTASIQTVSHQGTINPPIILIFHQALLAIILLIRIVHIKNLMTTQVVRIHILLFNLVQTAVNLILATLIVMLIVKILIIIKTQIPLNNTKMIRYLFKTLISIPLNLHNNSNKSLHLLNPIHYNNNLMSVHNL